MTRTDWAYFWRVQGLAHDRQLPLRDPARLLPWFTGRASGRSPRAAKDAAVIDIIAATLGEELEEEVEELLRSLPF